jgi:hypothetical protein
MIFAVVRLPYFVSLTHKYIDGAGTTLCLIMFLSRGFFKYFELFGFLKSASMAFKADPDPDPAFYSNADPDPASKKNADPSGSATLA